MGKSKELATLTDVGGTIDGALTITETSNQALNLTTTGLGSQVVYQSSTTNTPWYTGVAGSTADDFLIYQGATANAGDIYMYTNSYERMRIDASGRVTMPYQPAFRAYRSTDPGVNTSDGNMSWSGTDFNVGNHFANNRFTAPVAGTYIFGVNNNMGSGYSVSTWRLYKNGSPYHVLSYSDFTASWKNSSGSTLMQLQANDYIEAWWRGDPDYGITWCGFYGYLIG